MQKQSILAVTGFAALIVAVGLFVVKSTDGEGKPPLPYGASRGFGFNETVSLKAGAPQMFSSATADSFAAEDAAFDTVDGERQVIRSASMSVVVENITSGLQELATYVQEQDGFVVSSQIVQTGIAPTGHMTFRIPADGLEEALTHIADLGTVEEQSVHGQDVTEEFIDLEARITNLEASETQLLSLMQRTGNVADILAVQRELTATREQIERLQARQNYLQESVDLSLVQVYLSTDAAALPIIDQKDEWKPIAVAKEALRELLAVAKYLGNALIWLVVFIPLWLVLALIVLVIRHRLRKKTNE